MMPLRRGCFFFSGVDDFVEGFLARLRLNQPGPISDIKNLRCGPQEIPRAGALSPSLSGENPDQKRTAMECDRFEIALMPRVANQPDCFQKLK
jgi:hypothetical protein